MGRAVSRRSTAPPASAVQSAPQARTTARRPEPDRSGWLIVQLISGTEFTLNGMTFTRCPGLVDHETAERLASTGRFEITPYAQHRAMFARLDAVAA